MSGFEPEFVGLDVGFFGLPDKERLSAFNGLGPNCRVCRVLAGGESAGELGIEIENRRKRNQCCPAWRPFLDSRWTPTVTLSVAGWL